MLQELSVFHQSFLTTRICFKIMLAKGMSTNLVMRIDTETYTVGQLYCLCLSDIPNIFSHHRPSMPLNVFHLKINLRKLKVNMYVCSCLKPFTIKFWIICRNLANTNHVLNSFSSDQVRSMLIIRPWDLKMYSSLWHLID